MKTLNNPKNNIYPAVYIRKAKAKAIFEGHPWVFSGAIEKKDKLENGDLCEVYSGNDFLGIGYYNKDTDIAIRMISKTKRVIDTDFFVEKLQLAREQKEPFLVNTNAYRLCFGESDNLPGLIIDKYLDHYVIQFHTFGILKLKNHIIEAIKQKFSPACIYQKSALHSSKFEGEELGQSQVLFGKLEKDLTITENGMKFLVNIEQGQKTGFFLDQRENRKRIIPYCQDKKVLNCFCYTGGFSVAAGIAGAKQVTSVDISKEAIAYAQKNFEINDLNPKKHEFLTADVFDYLKSMPKEQFDIIILDPPSFARKQKQVPNAIKAYITINSKALEKLETGKILISSSCTAHIDESTFIKILYQSAVNTGCQLKILDSGIQPCDHAYNLHFPQGRYLKFFVMLKV